MNIIKALSDKKLLGQFLKDPETWRPWFSFQKAFYGLPGSEADKELFRACTGRSEWPDGPSAEAWVVCGRRSGKSFITALLATYHAAFIKHKLSAGEKAHVICVAPTRQQAAIIKTYISGFFAENSFLHPLVVRETSSEMELSNRVQITVLSSDYRSVRGHTAAVVIIDEVAFLGVEGASPDIEVLRALRPTLATTGGPLICISTPYARRGALYEAYKNHFGKDGDPVLVWQAPSTAMNPTLNSEMIARAMQEDPEGAAAEWEATFRSDVESFVSRDAVDAVVVPGRYELPVVSGVSYCGFVDPSGGSADGFTLAISHSDGGVRVLDVVREVRPPFSPEAVVEQYAELLKGYGIRSVVGDRYAGQWPPEQFRKHGIDYVPSERSKSELYLELLPLLNSGRIELLDSERLVQQLVRLERRTSRSGKDSVDHAPGGHDDLINAAAGALVNAQSLGPFLPDGIDNYLVRIPGHVPIGEELRCLPGDPGVDRDVM